MDINSYRNYYNYKSKYDANQSIISTQFPYKYQKYKRIIIIMLSTESMTDDKKQKDIEKLVFLLKEKDK